MKVIKQSRSPIRPPWYVVAFFGLMLLSWASLVFDDVANSDSRDAWSVVRSTAVIAFACSLTCNLVAVANLLKWANKLREQGVEIEID